MDCRKQNTETHSIVDQSARLVDDVYGINCWHAALSDHISLSRRRDKQVSYRTLYSVVLYLILFFTPRKEPFGVF